MSVLYRTRGSLPLRRLCEAWAPEIGGGTTPAVLAAELRAAGAVRRGAVARADALAFARARDIPPPRWWWEESDAAAHLSRLLRPLAVLAGLERDEPAAPPAPIPLAADAKPAASDDAVRKAIEAYIAQESATPNVDRCTGYVRERLPGASRDSQIRPFYRDLAGRKRPGRPAGKSRAKIAGK